MTKRLTNHLNDYNLTSAKDSISHSKLGITEKKFHSLLKQMELFKIKESDLIERFIRGSSSGGQKINVTASCVQLVHKPTGISVRCQSTRNRFRNRYYARIQLCEKFRKIQQKKEQDTAQNKHKSKIAKKRPSKKSKEKALRDKKFRAKKKANRKKVEI